MTFLSVTDLNKSFGKHHVLKDVSFTLETGEILGFIGPNGSGKSTTMKSSIPKMQVLFRDYNYRRSAGKDLILAGVIGFTVGMIYLLINLIGWDYVIIPGK